MKYINVTTSSGNVISVDQSLSLNDMNQNCSTFFDAKLGKRETYKAYRGCLIVRNTVNFSHGLERMTAAYLYSVKEKDFSCISAGSNVKSIETAKKLIDRVLDSGEYFYGIKV